MYPYEVESIISLDLVTVVTKTEVRHSIRNIKFKKFIIFFNKV